MVAQTHLTRLYGVYFVIDWYVGYYGVVRFDESENFVNLELGNDQVAVDQFLLRMGR